MVRYAMFIKFTDKGISQIKDSPNRAIAFKSMAAKVGVTVEGVYWLAGEYDGLVLITSPDEITASALALSVSSLGNVRTCLCRAFDEAEFKAIVGKM